MTHSILILTVTELSASMVRQSLVLADPPVAYYRVGEAPGSTIAVDSLQSAHSRAYKGASVWRVMRWNAPFTIEAWIQLIDDYQVDSRIPDDAEPGGGDGYGLDISLSQMNTPFNNDLLDTWGVPGVAVIHNDVLGLEPEKSRYQVEAVLETSALTSLVGLALILFGLAPRGWRGPLRYRGGDSGLSHASILSFAEGKFRRRSEPELNSFSARYATLEVGAGPPLALRNSRRDTLSERGIWPQRNPGRQPGLDRFAPIR